MRILILPAAMLLLMFSLTGCRGNRSEKPPIHPNLNMDFGANFKAQRANPFFVDGASMRQPVPGTVARGHLVTLEDVPYQYGRTADGAYVSTFPGEYTEALFARGYERYQIYCSVCHGDTGDGAGIIMVGNNGQGYGLVPAPTFHSDYLRDIADGYLYDVITSGVRTMPAYGHQIPVDDRWAIVAHIRALQRSQAASAVDLPTHEAQRLGLSTN